MSEKKPTFAGEVQFAGWTDSSRSGPRVTLRLADRDDLEKFVGCEGKRYMAVLVEIADDETPAEPAPAASPSPAARKPAAPRERMAPLCEWAVMRCGEPDFQRWAYRLALAGDVPFDGTYPNFPCEPAAKAVLLALCGLDPINGSRKELDTNPAAAKRFHERVRVPYAAWLAQQQRVAA